MFFKILFFNKPFYKQERVRNSPLFRFKRLKLVLLIKIYHNRNYFAIVPFHQYRQSKGRPEIRHYSKFKIMITDFVRADFPDNHDYLKIP